MSSTTTQSPPKRRESQRLKNKRAKKQQQEEEEEQQKQQLLTAAKKKKKNKTRNNINKNNKNKKKNNNNNKRTSKKQQKKESPQGDDDDESINIEDVQKLIGKCVWAKEGQYSFWPGILISIDEEGNMGKIEWFGDWEGQDKWAHCPFSQIAEFDIGDQENLKETVEDQDVACWLKYVQDANNQKNKEAMSTAKKTTTTNNNHNALNDHINNDDDNVKTSDNKDNNNESINIEQEEEEQKQQQNVGNKVKKKMSKINRKRKLIVAQQEELELQIALPQHELETLIPDAYQVLIGGEVTKIRECDLSPVISFIYFGLKHLQQSDNYAIDETMKLMFGQNVYKRLCHDVSSFKKEVRKRRKLNNA